MHSYQLSSEQLFWAKESVLANHFPDVEDALDDPEGLLAIGGNLSTKRLLDAYSKGIFPWYNEGQPILWWSPNPRCVLFPGEMKVSRSLRKTLKKSLFEYRMNTAFAEVITHCAKTRERETGTWITKAMHEAYVRLNQEGYAHSVEVWQDNELVGGLYGVQIGKMFFGESMFSLVRDSSKCALHYLQAYCLESEINLIDCQVSSEHLFSLGAIEIPRYELTQHIQANIET